MAACQSNKRSELNGCSKVYLASGIISTIPSTSRPTGLSSTRGLLKSPGNGRVDGICSSLSSSIAIILFMGNPGEFYQSADVPCKKQSQGSCGSTILLMTRRYRITVLNGGAIYPLYFSPRITTKEPSPKLSRMIVGDLPGRRVCSIRDGQKPVSSR